MACETCKFNLKNEIIGFGYFVSRNVGAASGRLRGFKRDIHSSNAEKQNPQVVQSFNGRLGIDRHGVADVVYDDLGGEALSDSMELNVAVSSRRRDGSSTVAKMQLRHYNDGARKALVNLKDGENVAYIVLNGKEVTDGIGLAISTMNGVEINSVSRLFPDMTGDQVVKLFKLIADKQGDLINLATDDKGVLYMMIKNVNIDLESAEFVDMLNLARVVEKKIDVKMPQVVKKNELDLGFLMRTLPVRDFKIGNLIRSIEISTVARETVKIKDVSFKLKDEVKKKEKLAESSAKKSVEKKMGVRENAVEEEMFEEREERVFADEQKIEMVEIAEREEAIILEEKKAVAKSFEVPKEVNKKLRKEDEALIVFQTANKALSMPIVSVLVEEKKGVLKTFEVPELFVENSEKTQGKDVAITEDVIEDEVAKICDGEKKEVGTIDEGEEREATAVVKEDGEELEVALSDEKDFENINLVVEEKVVSEEKPDVYIDGVVDYDRENLLLETSGVEEVTTKSVPVRVIFDANNFVVKKPKIIGEILIPEIIFQKPKTFKIPKVIFQNQISLDGFWKFETGAKMLADIDYSNPLAINYFAIFVPAILWWMEDALLPYTSVRV